MRVRDLRRDATDAERLLWKLLRSRQLAGYKFRRQHPMGGYIADFACTEHQLVVEVDGGQHAESAGDTTRTARLQRLGWRVLRFWNNDVLGNPEGVVTAVLAALSVGPSPSPLARVPSLSRGAGEGEMP